MQEILYTLKADFDCPIEFFNDNEVIVSIDKLRLLSFIDLIKKDQKIKANSLISIFAKHYPLEKKEFQITYLIRSMSKNILFRINVDLEENEEAISIFNIFQSATWYEREVYDMFGIKFKDKKYERILNDCTFEHYPLRKDFPVEGYNEFVYDTSSQEVISKKIDSILNISDYNI